MRAFGNAHRTWRRAYIQAAARDLHEAEAAAVAGIKKSDDFQVNTKGPIVFKGVYAVRLPADPPEETETFQEIASSLASRFVPALTDIDRSEKQLAASETCDDRKNVFQCNCSCGCLGRGDTMPHHDCPKCGRTVCMFCWRLTMLATCAETYAVSGCLS